MNKGGRVTAAQAITIFIGASALVFFMLNSYTGIDRKYSDISLSMDELYDDIEINRGKYICQIRFSGNHFGSYFKESDFYGGIFFLLKRNREEIYQNEFQKFLESADILSSMRIKVFGLSAEDRSSILRSFRKSIKSNKDLIELESAFSSCKFLGGKDD